MVAAEAFWVADGDGLRALHFAADAVVLLLQADRLVPGAHADRGLVTLLPDESVTYRVRGWSDADPDRLLDAVRCIGSDVGVSWVGGGSS